MRRTVPVVALTAGTLALLSQFHTSRATLNATALAPRTTESGPESPVPSTAGSTAAPATTGQPPASHPGTSGQRAATTTTRRATASSPTTTAPPSQGATRTIDGPVVPTRYGDVQVEVTVRGKQLIDVQALQLPSDRSRSVRISQAAGPILRSEALKAQSANIQMVSGASYTSDGYQQSLQAALDQASR